MATLALIEELCEVLKSVEPGEQIKENPSV